MRCHVELASAARRDLHRIGPGPARDRIVQALIEGLAARPQPANLNVKALAGAAPWLRLRVGDYRVLYRPLTSAEIATLAQQRRPLDAPEGFLVHRVVHRRDFERAVTTLL